MSKLKNTIIYLSMWGLSALVSWMAGPLYLVTFPSANSVILKLVTFILLGLIFSAIAKKVSK